MSQSAVSVILDAATANEVQQLATCWGVLPHEAVARAVHSSVIAMPAVDANIGTQAFRGLQAATAMTPEKAREWKNAIGEGRR